MNSRVVIVLGRKGVELVRLVPEKYQDERGPYKIYKKIKPLLDQIDKELRGRDGTDQKRH